MSDHLGLADEAGGVLLALDAGEAVVLDGIAVRVAQTVQAGERALTTRGRTRTCGPTWQNSWQ